MDTYLYREYAYSPKGQIALGLISGKKFRRTSIVAAKIGKKIVSPLQYDGPMDSGLFEHWFEHRLLRDLPPGSTIVLDNASFHRKKILHTLAKSFGQQVIFLPPYSPNLNPIEKFWAQLKQNIRSVIHRVASFDEALRYSFMSV